MNRIAGKRIGLMGYIARWSADEVSPTERMVKLQQAGLLIDSSTRHIPSHAELLPESITK